MFVPERSSCHRDRAGRREKDKAAQGWREVCESEMRHGLEGGKVTARREKEGEMNEEGALG